MKKRWFIWESIIALAVLALDLLTKNWFYNKVSLDYGVIGVVQTSALNTGGAWGILSSATWLLFAISIVFVIGVSIFQCFYNPSSPLAIFGIAFVIGGAMGNAVDRLARGGVRDFLFFPFWREYPIFNFADAFILVGLITLAIYFLFVYKPKGKKK